MDTLDSILLPYGYPGTLDSILLPYGYPGLFLASFLASTVLPLGSEGLVILLIVRNFNIFSVVLVATVGNLVIAVHMGTRARRCPACGSRYDETEIRHIFNPGLCRKAVQVWCPGLPGVYRHRHFMNMIKNRRAVRSLPQLMNLATPWSRPMTGMRGRLVCGGG